MEDDANKRNPADNLTREDRIRGGRRSAAAQRRGTSGRFEGRQGSSGSAKPQNNSASNSHDRNDNKNETQR